MKSFKLFLMLAIVMALAITLSASTPSKHESFLNNDDDESASTDQRQEEATAGRLLQVEQSARAGKRTCDKHPKICDIKGSPGPYCCNKKCVDIKTDKLNCGRCGKKCGYSKICCGGKCVNAMSNQKHCGGCNNDCGKGNSCLYGMCSYAN